MTDDEILRTKEFIIKQQESFSENMEMLREGASERLKQDHQT